MLAAAALLPAGLGAGVPAAVATEIERHHWTFTGVFGHFDRAQLQRGFQVYSEVCATCHGIKRIAFRNLAEKGGPEFPVENVKALAASFKVENAPDETGKVGQRPAKVSDRVPPPYKNDQEARSVHNGALPPDLSLIVRARNVESDAPWYLHPFLMLRDVVTAYQDGGTDYVYALLTSYREQPPAYVRDAQGRLQPVGDGENSPRAERCVSVQRGKNGPDTCNKLTEGMHYNAAFPSGQIAMIPPLQDGRVAYQDGTPTTLQNYAADVAAFLSWTSDPHLEDRKRLGWRVLLYLAITALLVYIGKKRVWAGLKE